MSLDVSATRHQHIGFVASVVAGAHCQNPMPAVQLLRIASSHRSQCIAGYFPAITTLRSPTAFAMIPNQRAGSWRPAQIHARDDRRFLLTTWSMNPGSCMESRCCICCHTCEPEQDNSARRSDSAMEGLRRPSTTGVWLGKSSHCVD